METPSVDDLNNRIYLSDFGTVCDIARGQRLSGKCGTSNYWSPEFYDKNYGHKVDNWATGVVMFGLTSGKFPFKNESDTRTKVRSAEGVGVKSPWNSCETLELAPEGRRPPFPVSACAHCCSHM